MALPGPGRSYRCSLMVPDNHGGNDCGCLRHARSKRPFCPQWLAFPRRFFLGRARIFFFFNSPLPVSLALLKTTTTTTKLPLTAAKRGKINTEGEEAELESQQNNMSNMSACRERVGSRFPTACDPLLEPGPDTHNTVFFTKQSTQERACR